MCLPYKVYPSVSQIQYEQQLKVFSYIKYSNNKPCCENKILTVIHVCRYLYSIQTNKLSAHCGIFVID